MNDFADWLSPIIVKELRQGMRARAFIGIFLAIQFFMIFVVLISLTNDSGSREAVTGLFWTVVGAAILFAMPLRGLATLIGEIKGNTLELMLLTRLSAWRVTAGKWLALMLQTLLLFCAVLPYVVLRYFLGGVNLIEDLTSLGWMLAGSALLTALAVGLSPFTQSTVVRIGLGFGMLLSLTVIPEMFLGARMGGGSGFPAMSTCLWAAALLGPLLVLELFELGVAKIAPAAENHATRKRVIATVILAIAVLLGRARHGSEFFLTLAAITLVPIGLGALMEETVAIQSLYRPFVRRKMFGRLAGKLLYPGWASGLLFFIVIVAAFLWTAHLNWSDGAVRFRVASGLEAIFAPLALVRLFFRRAKNILPFYFGLQLVLFVMAIILTSALDNKDPLLVTAALMPTIGFFLQLWGNQVIWGSNMLSNPTGSGLVVTAVCLLILFILSLKQWKIIGTMEREAAALE